MGKAWKLDHDAVVRMAREGKTRKEIAEAFGVTRQAVSHVLKPFGIPPAKGSRRKAPWTADAVRMASEGRTASEIAEAVGRSPERVRTVLQAEAGVVFQKRTDPAAKEMVLELRRQGMKYADIADAAGVTVSLAAKVCMDAANAGEKGLLTSKRGPRRKFGDADAAAIRLLLGEGRSQQEVAELTGWSQPTVCKVARAGED